MDNFKKAILVILFLQFLVMIGINNKLSKTLYVDTGLSYCGDRGSPCRVIIMNRDPILVK